MLWAVNSPRINHLGTKPIVGGRPPRENSKIGTEIKAALFLAHEIARVLMVLAVVRLRSENIQ